MKRTAKPDPYSLSEGTDRETKPAAPASASPPATLKPGMDLEPPIAPKEKRAPVEPGPVDTLKPGMDLEPPIEPKEKRAPIEPGRPAVPAAKPSAPKPGDEAEPAARPVATSTRFTDTLLGGVHVIAFSRRDVVDGEYIKNVGDDIYRHLKPSPQPKVVIDLANVQFLSSSALGMLIALRTVVVDKMSGGICIANVDDNIKEVFRITKLNKLMKIHDDTDRAIKSLIQ